MLHKIRLPFPPEKLAGVFALQMQLLELAGKVQKIDKQALIDHLKDEKLVEWLMSSYKRTIGPLNTFAEKCPDDTKKAILDELRHDYEFWSKKNDPEFSFLFTANESNRNLVAVWLRGYYEQFQRGIDDIVTRTEFVNKQTWLEAYKKANPDVKICPVCNGSLQKGIEIEHYFPREKYPVLSIHLSNMVPTCGDCNDYKENKDPLEFAKLTDLPLPYTPEAILDSCAIAVICEDGNYRFSLVPNDPKNSPALNALSNLFGIPDRWNRRDSINAIVDLAFAKIEEKIEADRDEGKTINSEDEFRGRLLALCKSIEKQKSKQPHFVPVGSWLNWAKDNMSNDLYKKICA